MVLHVVVADSSSAAGFMAHNFNMVSSLKNEIDWCYRYKMKTTVANILYNLYKASVTLSVD
jgi:hypothetical protein